MGFLSIALNKGDHDFGGLLRMIKRLYETSVCCVKTPKIGSNAPDFVCFSVKMS
jgi:hypothetical protein